MVKEKKIAIIPARGGSKRIPKKNIIEFHGKPMIAWTIEAALKSNVFDEVIVSTDNDEIAALASEYGAKVPFIRKEFADDYAPISIVSWDVLNKIQLDNKNHFDVVVQLMANCPLRKSEDIIGALKNFKERDVSSQISCFSYGWMNPWWALELNEEGIASPIFKEAIKKRSQDLPKLYCPTGAIWISKSDVLLKEKTFYSEGHIFWELPWSSAIDIDDENDLLMAKSVFSYLNNRE